MGFRWRAHDGTWAFSDPAGVCRERRTGGKPLWLTSRALGSEAQATPSLEAMGLFVLFYLGIAISLYPMIVPPHFTLWQAASSDRTQGFLPVGTLMLLRDPYVHRMVLLGVPRQSSQRDRYQ
jgi:hypothetical protein